MKKIEKEQFDVLVDGAEVISRDSFGDKVFRLRDGQILKLFRLKRVLSSALLWPYATRFARGAGKLHERQIPTVTVTAVFRVKTMQRDAVLYHPIAGETLRDVLAKKNSGNDVLAKFAVFLARVQDRGIYFRSIHFGNVIVLPSGDFGLIDLVEIQAYNSPLNFRRRLRNIKHTICYPEDHQAILDFGVEAFVDAYLESADYASNARKLLINRLKQ